MTSNTCHLREDIHRQNSAEGQLVTLEGVLLYREVEDEVKGTTYKLRIAEIHAISMKRLAKVAAADDPSDGADDE